MFTEPGWGMHSGAEIGHLRLGLSEQEKTELIEYLKSL